jgi:hypothetical protein
VPAVGAVLAIVLFVFKSFGHCRIKAAKLVGVTGKVQVGSSRLSEERSLEERS